MIINIVIMGIVIKALHKRISEFWLQAEVVLI
jgi:hypothetical protein